ncbi:hypothetical protein ASG35_13995 [Burkholderia sp. Leaf177]|uniref:Ig-like domain-containing protein n=1 Tax=Burkholderia sp. Leaf177 TaxID=1736287 RepID=UPI0006FB8A19|nr:Ig-like domain-containing protein [Burkholderia sp. Leaf177]KQR76217.1 hypothetical protein ASG35_13995 [Burkholderia sp. Leaf177]
MTLQTYEPSTAVITSVGTATSGGVANSTKPVITGTADAGNIVEVYDGIRPLGSTLADSNGYWELATVADIKTGSHSFAAIAHDTLGNFGASSALVHVAISAATLPAPVVTHIATSDGDAVPIGGATYDTAPSVSGTGKSGDTISLYDGTHLIGTAVVDVSGQWSVTTPDELVDGRHDFYAIETNTAGAHSAESNHVALTIDTSTPSAPVILGMLDHVGPVQGLVAGFSVIDDSRPTVFGTGQPGEVISLLQGMAVVGSTVVGADGTWAVRPDAIMSDGTYPGFRAMATNAAGTESSWAKSLYWFTIDTSTPGAPAITGVSDGLGSLIAPGGTTDVTRPVISGSGQPGHLVNVYDGSTLIGSSYVDGYGNWTVHPAAALSADVHNLSAIELTRAGVPGATSKHFLFLIETPVLKSGMHISDVLDHSDTANVAGHETSVHAVTPGEGTTEASSAFHVTSDHGIIDLTSFAAKPIESKPLNGEASSGVSQHAILKLSLADVLNAGEQDLFHKDGKQQLIVNGKEGDTVDLSNAHVAGLADGEWQQHGTAQVSGVTYNVYEHSGAHAELLAQQDIQVVVH